MSAVLVHIGCTGPYINSTRPPAHLAHCIDQYFLFNDDYIYLLTDRENLPHVPKRPSLITFAIEDYHSPKISQFEQLYNYGPREFWCVAVTRLMYIENLMRAEGLVNLCEFANDVLIYVNLNTLPFFELYDSLAITPCGPQHVLDGFMWIKEWQALADVTQFFIDVLKEHGVNGVCRKYGYDMVNEMTLMHLYSQEVGFDWLPILPSGEQSVNFEHFNSLFDPATYGQFVGGTRTDGPGVKPQNHYVGVDLRKHPEWDVVWNDENMVHVPYLKHSRGLARLNNLHIHSKRLDLYRSNAKCLEFS